MKESDLIRLAKQGDESAFTEIFNTYKLPLGTVQNYIHRSKIKLKKLVA